MDDKKSILKQIRDNLRNHGFETYYPTQHEGDCLSEYVVIGYSGSVDILDVSSAIDTYVIMCYVPKNKYSKLMEMVEKIREAMMSVFPLVRETGMQTVSYYDEDIKGHMVSIEYANYRKIKYRK